MGTQRSRGLRAQLAERRELTHACRSARRSTPDPGPDAGAVWHYGDPLGEQRAAAHDAVWVDRSHRAVLTLTKGRTGRAGLQHLQPACECPLPDGAVTENLSLDLQGRVEDHWIQTELDGVTCLDTEPWRAEPLLTYLRKMVFWAEVTVEPADLAVLSLLGCAGRHPVLTALGWTACPPNCRQSRCPAAASSGGCRQETIELALVVPASTSATGRIG